MALVLINRVVCTTFLVVWHDTSLSVVEFALRASSIFAFSV